MQEDSELGPDQGSFVLIHSGWSCAVQRRRFDKTLTFPDNLSQEAMRLREQAETMPPGNERQELLRKARQAETASRIEEWLSSPGLQSPK